jgi:DNA-binding MarR family transcriptional regulator
LASVALNEDNLSMPLRRHHTSMSELDHVLEFMSMLWRIEHGLHRISKRMNRTLGITGGQRLVLLTVSRYGRLSPNELARLLHLHPSTITGVVQRLESKKLLERNPDAHDSRRVHLRVSRKGQQFTRSRSQTVETAVTRALARIPREQLGHARSVLAALADALNADS